MIAIGIGIGVVGTVAVAWWFINKKRVQ